MERTITIGQVLSDKGNVVWTVSPDITVYEALQVMAEHNIGAVIAADNSNLLGIFSERDYARRITLANRSSKTTRIGELMVTDIITVNPRTTLKKALELMTNHHIRHLPVVENDKLVGVISIGDLVKKIIEVQASTIDHLTSYITGGYNT